MISQLLKKNIARGLVIVSLLSGTFTGSLIQNQSQAEAAMAQTKSSVNFRVGPSTNYSVIRNLSAGTAVDVISHGSSWSRVRQGGTSGYLSSRYINFTSTGLITSQVNLRDRSGMASKILIKIPAGQTVQVLAGPSSGWFKIIWGSLTGYVYKNYIDVSEGGGVVVGTPTQTEEPAPQADKVTAEIKQHTLQSSAPIYLNAADAANRTNSVGTYPAGTYYLYKAYSGMLNISKSEGQAGGWINPAASTAATAPVSSDPYAGYTKMTWTVSFYTSLAIDNGGYTKTAMGTSLRYGVLASNYWPLRSKVSLPGWGEFTVEDRGGSDFDSKYRLDMLIPRRSGESDYQYRSRIWAMGRKSISGYIKP